MNPCTDRVIIRLDIKSLFALQAGSAVDFELDDGTKIRLQAGGDAERLQWDIRRRQTNVVRQRKMGAKETNGDVK